MQTTGTNGLRQALSVRLVQSHFPRFVAEPDAAFFRMILRLLIFALQLAISSSSCPAGAVQGLESDNCYEFFTEAATWYEAADICRQRSGRLPSVADAFANAFLIIEQGGKTKAADFWLGGSKGINSPTTSTSWTWLDGSPVVYTNWDKGMQVLLGCCVTSIAVPLKTILACL